MNNTKTIFHSKTFWFNAFVVAASILVDQVGLLRTYLSDGQYLGLLSISGMVNVYLRTITNQPVHVTGPKTEL